MTQLPPLPVDPGQITQWVAGLSEEQQAALTEFNPEIELPDAPSTPSTYTVRVELVGARPPIWRRLALRSDLTLDGVHRVLQAAFGWEDYHLHRFSPGDPYRGPFFVTPEDAEEGETGTPEAAARLDQVLTEVGAQLTYEYDFGDSWTHRLLLEEVAPWPDNEARTAWCLTGRRSGPLEDSGGIGGYCDLAAWVRTGFAPDDSVHDPEDLRRWIPEGFDPDHFSVTETDAAIEAALLGDAALIARSLGGREGLIELLRRLPGDSAAVAARWLVAARSDGVEAVEAVDEEDAREATRAWRILLEHVGSGVALTQAGYLPPARVRTVYGALDLTDDWWGSGNREDATLPVLVLREQTQALGLLRKAKGRLTPTAAGRALAADPAGLLRHVAGRLPLGRRDDEQQAGWLTLLAVAAGEGREAAEEHVTAMMADLGWRGAGGSPLTLRHTWDSAQPTRRALATAGGDLVHRTADLPHPLSVRLARVALVGG